MSKHLITQFPMSSGLSEPRSEQCGASVWVSGVGERTSEWPSTYVPIHGCSDPLWKGQRGIIDYDWREESETHCGDSDVYGKIGRVGKWRVKKHWKTDKDERMRYELYSKSIKKESGKKSLRSDCLLTHFYKDDSLCKRKRKVEQKLEIINKEGTIECTKQRVYSIDKVLGTVR